MRSDSIGRRIMRQRWMCSSRRAAGAILPAALNLALRSKLRSPTSVYFLAEARMSEIRLLSTTAMKTTIDELVASFERDTGHTVAPGYAPSAQIAQRVAAGEQADVAIVTAHGIDDLIRQGSIAAGTRSDIARSAIALAVQKGAPRPDISSAE